MFMRNGACQKSAESWSPEGYGADSMWGNGAIAPNDKNLWAFFVQAFKKLAPISNKICEIRHNKVSPGGGETIFPRRWQFDPKISAD